MSDTTRQFKRQLPRNLLLNILGFVINVGIGLMLVPYLVNHLGKAAYGLIPIACLLTQYIGIITYSISSAINRYLTIALNKKDYRDANSIVSTAIFSFLGISLLQVPVFIAAVYYANELFNIPAELYRDAQVLLALSFVAFIINLIGSVFSVGIYAHNRIDIFRYIEIGGQVFRFSGIALMFYIFGAKLWCVGVVDGSVSVLRLLLYAFFNKHFEPELSIGWRYFDRRKIKKLTSMSWWLLINQVGALLLSGAELWVCNRLLGPVAAGEYAVLLKLSVLLRRCGGLFAGLVGPMVLIYYAKKEYEALIRLVCLAMRLFCLLLTIPIVLICVFAKEILGYWINPEFSALSVILAVMLIHLVVNIGVYPLFALQPAFNRVRVPGSVTLASGIASVLLTILLVTKCDLGLIGIAMASAIVLTCKNAFFTPLYAAHILGVHRLTFIKAMAPSLAFGGLFYGFCGAIRLIVPIQNKLTLVGLCCGLAIMGLVIMWLFIITREQKQLLFEVVPIKGQIKKAWPSCVKKEC